jgi:small subunit ribosomal protein S8
MSMNSLVADTLSRIRNAQMVGKQVVSVRLSKMVLSILEVLKDEGYILGYSRSESKDEPYMVRVMLKYHNSLPVIKSLKMLSKPGCRVYSKIDSMRAAFNGLGVVVVSTSKGVMSDIKARELGLGGELICEVY